MATHGLKKKSSLNKMGC